MKSITVFSLSLRRENGKEKNYTLAIRSHKSRIRKKFKHNEMGKSKLRMEVQLRESQPRSQGSLLPALRRERGRVGENPGNEVEREHLGEEGFSKECLDVVSVV